jgi:hypothetical protein
MVEAWFHENRQSPELRKKMWAPRTDADRALYDAGKDYDTAFFYMTPPSEYSRNTSMNEILTHGEGGEYRSTQNTDRECKEEIAVIYEQVTRVCKSWAAVERAMERVMAGDDISRDQLSMWEATFAEVVQEVKALRGEQYRFRDGWLFSRFPAAWEAVDAATHSLADGMLGLREHVLFKVQQTNPALIPGIADIDQPTVKVDEIVKLYGKAVERKANEIGAIKSNIKGYFRKLQAQINAADGVSSAIVPELDETPSPPPSATPTEETSVTEQLPPAVAATPPPDDALPEWLLLVGGALAAVLLIAIAALMLGRRTS